MLHMLYMYISCFNFRISSSWKYGRHNSQNNLQA